MLIKEICPGVGVQRVEVEDIEVFNIQALVGSTLIYFNLCSLEHTNYLITSGQQHLVVDEMLNSVFLPPEGVLPSLKTLFKVRRLPLVVEHRNIFT